MGEANIEVKEDLIQAAKEETEDVIDTIEELQEVLEEKKNIDELQEILEDNDIAGGEEDEKDVANDKAWEEAKEEMLENVEATMDETLPSTARLQPEEPSMQTLEEASGGSWRAGTRRRMRRRRRKERVRVRA